jgi:CheY-like chemotaxis protein
MPRTARRRHLKQIESMLHKVMIVTPVSEDTRFYQVLLEQLGYDIVCAHTPDEAVAEASVRQPDIVITELLEPTERGWRTPELLRNIDATKHVPIVAVTGWAMPDDRARALRSGCDVVLIKPVTPRELAAAIQQMLRKDED